MYPQTCVRAVFEIKGKVSLLSHVETSDAKKKRVLILVWVCFLLICVSIFGFSVESV